MQNCSILSRFQEKADFDIEIHSLPLLLIAKKADENRKNFS
jgi:hypothetical protein